MGPKSKNELSERVSGNYSYFLTNYVIILLFMLAYSILTRPFLLIFLLAFCYFWLVVSKKEQINITDTIKIKGKVKYSIFITIALTLWILLAGNIIATVFLIFSVFVVFHMIFHEQNESVEAGNYSEIESGPFP